MATVPIELLLEAVKHSVTVELKNGEVYRGELASAEDNMNVHMNNVSFTARNGQVRKLEQIYLRGSYIRLFVLPDFLKRGPVLKKVSMIKEEAQEKSAGRGRGRGRGR